MANSAVDPTVEAAVAINATKTLAQLIEQRQGQLESDEERGNWAERTRNVIRYSRSDLLEYLDETAPTKGGSTTQYMYTSKPTIQLERAADALCGHVFTSMGWFGLSMSDPRLAGVDELQQWLEVCEHHLYSVYAASNFYAVMPQVAMDALSIGDGPMYVGNDLDAGLPFFEYRQPMGMWWKRDRFGRMITVHERVSMSALEAYDRWGNRLGSEILLAARANPTKVFTFLHAVYKANDAILEGFKFAKRRPYIEVWLQEKAQENQGHSNPAYEGAVDRMGGIIEQSGYFEMPYMDWPYWLKSGETHGRGPLSTALYSVKRCHAEHKQMMLAGQRAAAPSLWATSTLKNKIDLSPDGITYMADPNRDKVQELHRDIRYPFGIDQLDRTENEIAEVLHLHDFMMFSQITKEMRVDEIIERIGEKAAVLAPRIGLMQKLLLDPIHARVWQIERLNRRLPEPPDILYELAEYYGFDTGISVRYTGPLAAAHEQVFMHRRIAGAFQMLTPFVTLDPETVKASIKTRKGVEDIMDNAGLAGLVTEDEEYEQTIAALNQASMEQQQVEVAEQAAGAIRKYAQADKSNREGPKE